MKRIITLFFLLLIFAPQAQAAIPDVSISPTLILQGDAIMTTIDSPLANIKEIIFREKKLKAFSFGGKTRLLIGIDLTETPGDYVLILRFKDGEVVYKIISIRERVKISKLFSIPDSFTPIPLADTDLFVQTLIDENEQLKRVFTSSRNLWSTPFVPPLSQVVVTDVYGYIRKTGKYNIAHKGTDFRAATGTRVRAINRGVVRVASTYNVYGKTVVVDHGLGLQSFYMHLSKINVSPGQIVNPGQVIGLSGQSGLEYGAHLHLSIKINGVSVDPVAFFNLFEVVL